MTTNTFNPARFDFVSIQLAVACAQAGSLTAAARHSHLSLAAASRRIRELEEALGSPLFERHARGLITTAAGKIFIRHGFEILGRMELLDGELKDLRQGVARHVRLWASTAAITQFLPPLLARFGQLAPQVRIDLEEQVSEVVVLSLLDGRADAGILVEGPDAEGLDTEVFAHDELVLVLPHHHRLAAREAIAFADTLSEDFIGLSTGAAVLQRLQQMANAAGRPLRLCMQVRSFDAVCRMVAAGLGIAILPKNTVLPIMRSMNLVTRPLSDPWAHRRILVATRAGERDATILRLAKFLVNSGSAVGPEKPSQVAKAARRKKQ